MDTSLLDVNMIQSIGRKFFRQIFGRLQAKGVSISVTNDEIARFMMLLQCQHFKSEGTTAVWPRIKDG